MTNKKDNKITEAGAVELEENELDQVTGGASYTEMDSKGKKITTIIAKDPISRGPAGFATEEIKRVK